MIALVLTLAFVAYASWSDHVVNGLDILGYIVFGFAAVRFIVRWVS